MSDEGMKAARRVIGRQIRACRERAEVSQEQLAERLGVGLRTLRNWETGNGKLPTGNEIDFWRQVASALGLPLREVRPRNQYPGLPLDPEARREAVAARTRVISGRPPE